MRVVIRTGGEEVSRAVLSKLKENKVSVPDCNMRTNYIVAQVTPGNATVLFDLLNLNITLQRDAKNDLE